MSKIVNKLFKYFVEKAIIESKNIEIHKLKGYNRSNYELFIKREKENYIYDNDKKPISNRLGF